MNGKGKQGMQDGLASEGVWVNGKKVKDEPKKNGKKKSPLKH